MAERRQAVRRQEARTGRASARPRGGLTRTVDARTARALLAERAWARDLEPDKMAGLGVEVTMLRQTMRDAFLVGDAAAVRQCAEALRRLLRERAPTGEPDELADDDELEEGLSTDLRRILHRVGLEMGVDV